MTKKKSAASATPATQPPGKKPGETTAAKADDAVKAGSAAKAGTAVKITTFEV